MTSSTTMTELEARDEAARLRALPPVRPLIDAQAAAPSNSHLRAALASTVLGLADPRYVARLILVDLGLAFDQRKRDEDEAAAVLASIRTRYPDGQTFAARDLVCDPAIAVPRSVAGGDGRSEATRWGAWLRSVAANGSRGGGLSVEKVGRDRSKANEWRVSCAAEAAEVVHIPAADKSKTKPSTRVNTAPW